LVSRFARDVSRVLEVGA